VVVIFRFCVVDVQRSFPPFQIASPKCRQNYLPAIFAYTFNQWGMVESPEIGLSNVLGVFSIRIGLIL
jgi:hypothetical protein